MNKKYWYFIWHGECPVCGKDKSFRERRYTPRPKDIQLRHGYSPMDVCYDYCLEREAI